MDTNQIYIENIGVGLININNLYKLDLKLNEYLVVGQRNNITPESTIDTEYNMVVNNNGVGINATRRELRDTNAGLLVNNNIICKGTVSAKNFEFENFTLNSNITNENLSNLIKSVNSNLLFYTGYPNNYNKVIYTPSYLSVGNYASTFSNFHPLKISDSPNGFSSNIQFAIYNNINNEFEPSRFSFGMLGYNPYTPANISTTYGMPLEFHISKQSYQLNELYSNGLGLPVYKNSCNYPEMSIDMNRTVNINKNACDLLLNSNSKFIKPQLYVNGILYASNIYTYDYFLNSNLHLDNIYVRKNGLTIDANQIRGGEFTKAEFTFNSNVNIGKETSNYLLTVNSSAIIKNTLTTDNLIACKTTINGEATFNKTSYFNNNTIFNDEISINRSLNVSNDLFINGYRVNTSNLEYAKNGLNFDFGSNLNISGRFGTGIYSTDTYDHQFNIIKRKQERFEIYMNDLSGITTDSSKVYIGHSSLNNLNGNIDNSLIFLTQKNIRWHNIYFYPGKDKDGCHGFKTLTPTLAIMENNRIGINTNMPNRTLDIIGDLTTNDYYIKKNNTEYKINPIYFVNNSSILKVNNLNINLNDNDIYPNLKTVNLTGGINSYDGYFQGDFKLSTFIDYPNLNISSINNNIGIGIIQTNNNYPIPLQIRNTNTGINNNSIIRLYRGVRGGGFNNDALYTGIDFCDYDMPIPILNRNNYKWFIYKNHKAKDNIAGVLQVGYTNNTVNPTHSCMNFYYNDVNNKYFIDINNPQVNYDYDKNTTVSIKGNVDIQGNLNLIGENSTYKINGIIVGSFSNPAIMQEIPRSHNNIYSDKLNDISLISNKTGILVNKSTVFGFYKDDWIFTKINNTEIDINNSPIFIYNNKDYVNETIPPVITKFYNKSFKNYTARPDIAIIELGVLADDSDSGTIKNKVQLAVKGYEDKTIFDISANDKKPYITCINYGEKNQINIGNKTFYTATTIENADSAVNINDDFDYLLKLTNNSKAVKVGIINDSNNWNIAVSNKFDLSYNTNNSLINLSSNGIFNLNNYSFSSNNSSFNLNACLNKSCAEFTNFYYNDYSTPITSFETKGYINNFFSNLKPNITDTHYDSYDDNFDTNISRLIYKIDDSNLPTVDINDNPLINYNVNNCNFTFNNFKLINFNFNASNITSDFKYLENVSIDDKLISIIPVLKSYNPNVSAFIKTSNIIPINYNIDGIQLDLNYKIPRTKDADQLQINSIIENSNSYSNFNNNRYSNLTLRTILNVKNNRSADYSIKTINSQFIIASNNSNYHYNTTNKIYYFANPDITFDSVNININYNYNYRNEIIVPTNFFNNYTNQLDIVSVQDNNVILNNNNSYLTTSITGSIPLPIDATGTAISKNKLSTHIIQKIYPVEINNINVMNAILTFTKNNFFDVYSFSNEKLLIPLPIIISKFQPHLILKNYINSKYSAPHKFYSYNNNYEIHLDNNKLLSLDSNGNIDANGSLNIKNIYFTGDIISKSGGNTLTSVYSNLTQNNFNIQKHNISLNSSNLFLNPSIINKGGVIINGGDIYSSNNLFEINNYTNYDNFITLKSITNSGFIHYSGTDSVYRMGMSNGNFGIWNTKDPNIISCKYLDNSFTNFNNVISFNYNPNIQFPTINLDGNIVSSSNLAINNITTYVNNSLNYRLRVFGNVKVDGAVMSSSDIRIKTNITKIESALDKISKLNGITYNKLDNLNRETGLIAQEVKEVLPEAVFEDENGLLNIAYGNLMGLIIEAIKELKLIIK
jgi:hypothetical protein